MKRIIFLSLFPFMLSSAYSQMVSIGAGYAYGFGLKQSGANLRGVYHLTYRTNIAVEYNMFFPRVAKVIGAGEPRTSRNEIQANIRFNIPINEKLFFYPIAGLSYITEKETIAGLNESNQHKTREAGINGGAGLSYQYKKLMLFTELMAIYGQLGLTQLRVGVAVKDFWSGK